MSFSYNDSAHAFFVFLKMVHQTDDNLIPSCTRLIQIFKGEITTVYFFSIHGVSHFGVGKSTTCKRLAQVSQINWSFTHSLDWWGQYWCTAGSARQFPPAAERGHVHSCAVRQPDAYLLCIGMTCRSPWCVLSLFSCFFLADIRERKNKLEDKASSSLACEQALPPPSLPTPVPLAHRLAAFFFFFTEANCTTIR